MQRNRGQKSPNQFFYSSIIPNKHSHKDLTLAYKFIGITSRNFQAKWPKHPKIQQWSSNQSITGMNYEMRATILVAHKQKQIK